MPGRGTFLSVTRPSGAAARNRPKARLPFSICLPKTRQSRARVRSGRAERETVARTEVGRTEIMVPGSTRFRDSIIEPQPFQNSWRVFLHARGAGGRLFRPGKMQQIAFLPSGSERMEGFCQFRVVIQTLSKLLGHIELRHAFHLDLGAGFLNRDGLPEIGLNCRFPLLYIRKRSKSHLPRGLHILCLLNEDALGV